VNKIKSDHEIFSKEEKTLRNEGSRLSIIKAKMIEPIKVQLSHAYDLAGARGGWK